MMNTHFEFRDPLINSGVSIPINNMGETLRLRRTTLNLSQRKLADLAGVSRTCIRNAEENITNRTRSLNVWAIEKALVIEENRRVTFLRSIGYI